MSACRSAFLALACAASAAAQAPVAFTDVTVIPLDTERRLADQTVVVRDGRVVAMGPAATTPVPAGATRVDGRGRFLMPGLAEMHAHVPGANAPPEIVDRVLQLYTLFGNTTARSMLGDPSHLPLRERIARGETLGPRLVTSGPSFNGNTVPTAAAATAAVEAQRAAGYDFLKIHPGVPRAAFDAMDAAADRLGLTYSGHVPLDVGLDRALEARYATIDHLDGLLEAMLRDGSPATTAQTGWFGLGLVDELDPAKLDALATRWAASGVGLVATQTLMENYASGDPGETLAARWEMAYWLPNQLANWTLNKNNFLAQGMPADRRQRYLTLRRRAIKALHDRGVPLLLGSDAPQVWNVPGVAAHRELQEMVRAGLTPYQALRTGTVNVARFFGWSDAGSVAVGQRADLLLLDADPLADVANTLRLYGVMVHGRWIDAAERTRRLEALRTR
jgi:imidazolonepropionase-like amidohydrolase